MAPGKAVRRDVERRTIKTELTRRGAGIEESLLGRSLHCRLRKAGGRKT